MATTTDSTPSLSRVIHNVSIAQIITATLAFIVLKWVARGIHRVYFHPLRRFPGPKFSAFTRIPQIRATLTGSTHSYVRKLHREYGHVVRIAPDELSFTDPQAWRDIYGHGTKGTRGSPPPKHFLRYSKPPNGSHSLITSNDADHARMRRIFTPAFSDRALKSQEPLFMKYVDKLIMSLKTGLLEDPLRKFDMVRMYNFTTFDVMGDLTFGEPLHMLDNAEYDPWVGAIFGSVKIATRISVTFHYPWLTKAFRTIAGKYINKKAQEHSQHATDRVTKRLEKGRQTEGVDLWDLVLKQDKEKGLTRGEMDSNSSLFMIAGTETTATLLSGLTYLLLKNPEAKKKLVDEVRTAFASSGDMSMESIAALPYLNACIKEAFRLYPPVVDGLPRRTVLDGSTICGEYVPPGFTVTAPHLAMYTLETNFKEPLSFIPERWLGEERFADDQRAAVQPFVVGTRDCLGKNMAYHEMRLIITKVLFNFDLELCPESDGWIKQDAYILWQKSPLMVRLKDIGAS